MAADHSMFSGAVIIERATQPARLPREQERAKGLRDRQESNNSVAIGEKYHDMIPAAIEKSFDVQYEQGLKSAEAAARLLSNGENKLQAAPRKSIFRMFFEQFTNVIVIILLCASTASLALGEHVEGTAILTIVVLNAIVAVMQERSADNALAALQSMSAPSAMVRRDGAWDQIDSIHIVVGDVVKVQAGDVIPADVRVFESADLTVTESALTGESIDVGKFGDYIGPEYDAKQAEIFQAEIDARREHSGKDIHHRPTMLFASTVVTNGNGVGVVVETGMNTRIGRIAQLLSGSNDREAKRVLKSDSEIVDEDRAAKKSEELSSGERKSRCSFLLESDGTPLQQSLHRMGVYMGFGAITICVVVFIVGILIDHEDPSHGDRPVWLQMLMVAVSLAVSGVPEGLPACVTICLAMGMQEMVNRNALIRSLPACETLGSASIICTDKTGTLTAGEMTAKQLYVGGKDYTITGGGFQVTGEILSPDNVDVSKDENRNALVDTGIATLVLCNSALVQQDADGKPIIDENGKESLPYEAIGGSTERPLVILGAKNGMWKEQMDDEYPKLLENAYASKRKMMSTVHAVPADCPFRKVGIDSKYVCCIKGAPNYVLRYSTHIMGDDGQARVMTQDDADRMTAQIDAYSDRAFRVLAMAYKNLDAVPSGSDKDNNVQICERDLVFVGLVASLDPERPEAVSAIADAHSAGLKVIMITGDYLNTARAIARNINLVDVKDMEHKEAMRTIEYQSVDCNELRQLDDTGEPLLDAEGNYVYKDNAAIDELTARVVVFARAQPQDKFEIVKSLQTRQGHVCAMTGDGVNDAPALKEAAIGISMGIAGTETAKQASDMILIDDNFASIVLAIEEGRTIYQNIQRFVSFLLSTNFAEILVIFICIVIGLPSPLEPLQILFLNLASDGLPALALSREKPESDVMKAPPRDKNEELIHGWMWLAIISNSIALMIASLSVFLIGMHWYTSDPFDTELSDDHGVKQARTMVFIMTTLSEYMRAYTVRHATRSVFSGDLFGNKILQICICISASLMAVVLFIPGVNDIFGFVGLEGRAWLCLLGFSIMPLLATEVVKIYLRYRGPALGSLPGSEVMGSKSKRDTEQTSHSMRFRQLSHPEEPREDNQVEVEMDEKIQ
jgi:P-type Ca2+ transporter type 2C